MPHRSGEKPGRAADPRPARTRAAILDAIERLGAKGSDLSVATIVAEAQLSRSSFYSQFKDLPDVAVQLMGELYEELDGAEARTPEAREDDGVRAGDGARASARARTESLILELRRRRHLYAAVLGTAMSAEALREICGIIARGNLATVRRIAPEGVEPEKAALYTAAGSLAVLTEWLAEGARTPVDEVREELFALLPAWIVAAGS